MTNINTFYMPSVFWGNSNFTTSQVENDANEPIVDKNTIIYRMHTSLTKQAPGSRERTVQDLINCLDANLKRSNLTDEAREFASKVSTKIKEAINHYPRAQLKIMILDELNDIAKGL